MVESAKVIKMPLPAAMALSGLEEEHFSEGLNDMFNHGARLLKSPSSSSVASNETAGSQESGISSMSSDTSVAKNLGPYFDLLSKTEVSIKAVGTSQSHEESGIEELKIIHDHRDVLDLASNINWRNWRFQPAMIRNGIQYFFENRSQYSRLLGAQIPEHVTFYCPFKDCHFGDLIYVK